jgi:MFS family permease
MWRDDMLRRLAIALALMNGTGAAVMATYVLFVQEILELDGFGFGVLLASGSIGGVLGSVLGPVIAKRIGPGRTMFLTLSVPIVTFGVTAVTSSPIVVAAMFIAFSFLAVLWNVVTVSLRQTMIPDAMLGRVNSVYRFFGWGAMPIGTLLGGALVSVTEGPLGRELGLRTPFVASVLVYVVLAVFFGRHFTNRDIEAARARAPGA